MYFELLFRDVLPHVCDKREFFHQVLLGAFVLRCDCKEIIAGISQAASNVQSPSDLEVLAEEVWGFNARHWKIDDQWILDTVPESTGLGAALRRSYEQLATSGLESLGAVYERVATLRAATSPGDAAQSSRVLTDDDLREIESRMFLLPYYANTIQTQPFAGFRFLIVLHFLKDLVTFLVSCEKLGLRPSETILFCKDYLYPDRQAIGATLHARGYEVLPLSERRDGVRWLLRSCPQDERVAIIEDGGYIVPLVHEEFQSELDKVAGAVEQTTRGIRNDRQLGHLAFNVHSVADAQLKEQFEPPHVARAIVDNIRKLVPSVNFSGKQAAVLGYGTIGRHVALQLGPDNLKMVVSVFDPEPNRRLAATQDGFLTRASCGDAVANRALVVGCSGETSVGREELLRMDSGTLVASGSSDQKEIGLLELEALSDKREDTFQEGRPVGTKYRIRSTDTYLHLLANGYPVNFWGSESMPDEASDLVMSLILLATNDLCCHHARYASGINASDINDLAEQHRVAKLYMDRYHPGG